jgi:hypothetical protein
MYESDITRFIRELRQKNPGIEELQRKNRATWWDKPQDLELNRERAEAAVPQPAYVYFPLPVPDPQDDPDSAKKLSTPNRAA